MGILGGQGGHLIHMGLLIHGHLQILINSTNSTHGKRASFSQNSQTWRPFSENLCFSWKVCEFLGNLQILPMGNVRHFRRIRKNDALLLNIFVFVEIKWILGEIYKLYPWEACAIFAEFAKMTPFCWTYAFFVEIKWILGKIYKFYPWEACVIFAEFAKMTALSENVRLFRRNQHFPTKLSEILINSEPQADICSILDY